MDEGTRDHIYLFSHRGTPPANTKKLGTPRFPKMESLVITARGGNGKDRQSWDWHALPLLRELILPIEVAYIYLDIPLDEAVESRFDKRLEDSANTALCRLVLLGCADMASDRTPYRYARCINKTYHHGLVITGHDISAAATRSEEEQLVFSGEQAQWFRNLAQLRVELLQAEDPTRLERGWRHQKPIEGHDKQPVEELVEENAGASG